MNQGVFALILGLLVAGSLGAGYLAGTSSRGTVASTATITHTETLVTTTTMQSIHPQVQIVSIKLANESVGGIVGVNITFRNTGNVAITYCGGNCRSFNYTVDPPGAIQQSSSPYECPPLGTPAIITQVNPGQEVTLSVNSCRWSGSGFVVDKFLFSMPITINVIFIWGVTFNDTRLGSSSSASQNFMIH
jgi:hypothetical protein